VESFFAGDLLFLLGPSIIVGMLGHLLITSDAPLPMQRLDWILKPMRRIRSFGGSKLNQWGMGDHGFKAFFAVFVLLPVSAFFFGGVNQYAVRIPERFVESGEPVPAGYDLYIVSIFFGLAGSLFMSFFLIPVSRHNILLAAVGWSPFHALKLHILSGYFAYGCIALHGFTYLIYMFKGYGADGHERIIDQIVPDRSCWVWKPSEELYEKCYTQWWNITGWIAFFFMTALTVTSLHWVRCKYYRVFYVCHVIFGSLSILFSIMHCDFLVIYMFPSLAYYVASTAPVMVQALASRFRGGVKLSRVVTVEDSGGCVEVHIAVSSLACDAMKTQSSLVVKMCVPTISLVWHPFTVYTRPGDSTTACFLMRPMGQFTQTLAARIVKMPRPVMILDGFHRGGDRVHEALCHDVVTIVAGGVALSPFLSMIPALLQSIKKAPVCPARRLVVHWACRQGGLASFIERNYFAEFERMASELGNEFTFDVVVYHTATTELLSHVDGDDTKFDSEKVSTLPDGECSSSTGEKACAKTDSGSDNVVKHDVSLETAGTGSGHVMEPARFMPALFPYVHENLTQFVLMSALLWIGLVLYSHYLNNAHFKVLHWVAATWSTILWVLIGTTFAILCEIFFLFVQKHYPRPIPETYQVTANELEEGGSQPSDGRIDISKKPNASEIQHRSGRPTAKDVFAGLEESYCPGIFLCGPHGLTEMVRDWAKLENSPVGLVRYALYEEPFEM
jgi:predicted ferric reductase